MKNITINIKNFIKKNKKKIYIATTCTAATTLATFAALKLTKKDI